MEFDKKFVTIVGESIPLLGKKFKDESGNIYTFEGVLYGHEDHHYLMTGNEDDQWLSCASSLEDYGFTLVKED